MSNNKVTILHFVDSGGAYGIEKMIMSLLSKLKHSGFNVMLAYLNTYNESDKFMNESLSESGVIVQHPERSDRFGITTFFYIINTLYKFRPSIIHLHGYKAIILGAVAARLMNIPCVATYHAEIKYTPNLAKYVKIETIVLKFAKMIVAVSQPIKKELELRNIRSNLIRIIPNGIDDLLSDGKQQSGTINGIKGSPKILFVGRLIEKKNIHVLLKAIALLKENFENIRLIIAGEGPFQERLERLIAELKLVEHVIFLGYVADVNSLYQGCDCFVLPSQTEGMPISLLEAMSSAKPIVVTSVGSIPKVVKHQFDALIVEPNNIKELYAAMKRILNDPLLQRDLGNNARDSFLEKYTSDIMAQRYIEVYNQVS